MYVYSAVCFHLLVLRRVPSSVIHLLSTLQLLTRKVPTVGDLHVRVSVSVSVSVSVCVI